MRYGDHAAAVVDDIKRSCLLLPVNLDARSVAAIAVPAPKFFKNVYGKAVEGGDDMAVLHDSADSNVLEAVNRRARFSYGHTLVEARKFDRTQVTSRSGGDDVQHVESIDFLLELVGMWREM